MEKTLLIANPASQNGNGARLAERAAAFLRSKIGEDDLSVVLTMQPKQASDIAMNAHNIDRIITLGGDGAIHEVVNGLMRRKDAHIPILGIIPAGSGNDYAKALRIPFKFDEACDAVLSYKAKPVDIGKVNGEYFMETLSFGLDAAIALDTMERRKRTGRKGTILYMESGFDQLMNHMDIYDYEASFDHADNVEGQSYTFAVQIGPYYGGGFKICPDAEVDGGHFSICIAHPPMNTMKALALFLRAKSGAHTSSANIELLKADSVRVEFETEPPAQIDGEKIEGTVFDISMEYHALKVLRP